MRIRNPVQLSEEESNRLEAAKAAIRDAIPKVEAEWQLGAAAKEKLSAALSFIVPKIRVTRKR